MKRNLRAASWRQQVWSARPRSILRRKEKGRRDRVDSKYILDVSSVRDRSVYHRSLNDSSEIASMKRYTITRWGNIEDEDVTFLILCCLSCIFRQRNRCFSFVFVHWRLWLTDFIQTTVVRALTKTATIPAPKRCAKRNVARPTTCVKG